MSLIEFLASVFSRIYYIFATVWGVIQWIVGTAYSALYNYVYSYQSAVHNLSYSFYNQISTYSTLFHGNASNILYSNFHRTNTLVNGFFDIIADYVNSVRYKINDIVVNFYQKMLVAFGGGWGILSLLLNIPSSIHNYVFGDGANASRDYQENIRQSAHRLKDIEPKLQEHVKPEIQTPLFEFARTLYSNVKELATTKFNSLIKIVGNAGKILHVFDDIIYPKLEETFTSDYDGLKGLIDIAGNIIDLVNGNGGDSGGGLDPDTRNFLLEFINNPAEFILDLIKAKLLGFVGGLLFDWLYHPYEE